MIKKKLFQTHRFDLWWTDPLLKGLGFLSFVIYTTWAMFQGNYYWWSGLQEGFGGYLSPFYSPLLFIEQSVAGSAPIEHAWFGPWPNWMPNIIPITPAILILAGPLSFRMTCYYYRKFYYRSYFLSPPACAVMGLPQKKYKGETALLVIQNLHRFTLYVAIGFVFVLSYDAILAFFRNGEFGIGVGTFVLILNVILLGGYTFGCHSLRHLIGGYADRIVRKPKVQQKAFDCVNCLNKQHMKWAWFSLFWVCFTDVYVRLCASGIIDDWRIF